MFCSAYTNESHIWSSNTDSYYGKTFNCASQPSHLARNTYMLPIYVMAILSATWYAYVACVLFYVQYLGRRLGNSVHMRIDASRDCTRNINFKVRADSSRRLHMWSWSMGCAVQIMHIVFRNIFAERTTFAEQLNGIVSAPAYFICSHKH